MIFIIDDNPDDIELTKIAAEVCRPEIRVTSATTGDQALEFLHAQIDDLPSLILLDIKLPGMSGIDILTELQNDSKLRGIPVVIVTSSLLESDRKTALDAGASDYLHKNVRFNDFCEELKTLLERWLPII